MTKRIPRELIRDLEWYPGKELPEREPPQPQVLHESAVSIEDLLEHSKAFKADTVTSSLRDAQEHAGEEGYVATLPELLQARIEADRKHMVWQYWYSVISDEYVGPGPDGKPVVVVLHGGGLLTPERIEWAYEEGLTDTHAAKLDDDEWADLLEGMLPDGAMIQMYNYDDFKGSADELPRRYGVVIDFEEARNTQFGRQDRDSFLANPLAIARSGGEETAAAYFDRAQKDGKLGCWHPFASVDPSVAQGRVLFVYNDYGGLDGSLGGSSGRFLGVRPNALEARRARGGKR